MAKNNKGKIKCFVTGELRNDIPEEHVRQRMARSLVEEYGYVKNDLELEFVIPIGTKKPRADIVIFDHNTDHHIENIIVIIEAKRDEIKITDKDQGVNQLKSYMSATLNAKYGMWIGSEFRAYEKIYTQKKFNIIDTLDIPFADGKPKSISDFTDLIPATDGLSEVFKRCHNYITANYGLSKESAFHEFLKIIFCKAYDEKNSEKPLFYIETQETRTKSDRKKVKLRIQNIFSQVCESYDYIFKKDEKIELNENVCAYIVTELQKYSLLDTDFDYKGRAYEEIVGANSRGDRGEFFTPRNLCSLTVNILLKLHGDDLNSIRVIDPACGTGGFLKSFINTVYQKFYLTEKKKWKNNITKAKNQSATRLKEYCDKKVFGVDFNPVLVKASQMNLVMHGDGSTNIFHDNSLLGNGELKKKTRESILDEEYNIVITNPPFGEDLIIDDAHVLGQYELSVFGTTKQRKQMQPQELFIEKCLKFLKPNGLLGIILPDSILTNPNKKFIRKWIQMKFVIIGSISLPLEMFLPSTGTQTSLLIMQKRENPYNTFDELCDSEPYDVFFSIPQKIGHDKRGTVIPKRDKKGEILYCEKELKYFIRKSNNQWDEKTIKINEYKVDDDLPMVYEDFCKWLDGKN